MDSRPEWVSAATCSPRHASCQQMRTAAGQGSSGSGWLCTLHRMLWKGQRDWEEWDKLSGEGLLNQGHWQRHSCQSQDPARDPRTTANNRCLRKQIMCGEELVKGSGSHTACWSLCDRSHWAAAYRACPSWEGMVLRMRSPGRLLRPARQEE